MTKRLRNEMEINMNQSFKIGNHTISKDSPVFVIAEMSANHLQDFNRAMEIVHAAKEAGADALKLQTYTADTITIDSDLPDFQITQGTIWDGTTLYRLYQEAYTPWEWQPKLMEEATKLGMECFSSPFDFSSVDFMAQMNMPAIKIASYEINDIPLIRKSAALHKPMIISTGIAHLEDIERALNTCKEVGNEDVMLLKCVSSYPTPYEDINLAMIPTLATTFNCLVGLSDHTMGSAVSAGSIPFGVKVVEKHLTLSRKDGGPDGAFSMEPDEFKQMVRDIRIMEKAIGSPDYHLTKTQEIEHAGSRSLYVVEDIAAGTVINEKNVRSIRPGNGLHTMYYEQVLGKKVNQSVKKGTPLSWDLLS